ncbi:MAG: hypothetical protein O2797_06790 [Bacteroidetes bacterium]|nr:hypothetical protein [Bacteroidota bacterium]MDA1333908.1 hypothetical protein [Bacteroidota bacterium]
MDSVYLISLIVGGFFVLLSIFGSGENGSDSDHDFDADHDMDLGGDVDVDHDVDFSSDADHDFGDVASGGPDFVDLFSIRALFLFAAFFGLTGVVLGATGTAEPFVALLSTSTGLLVGLGGNWIIKRFAYAQVSSLVTPEFLKGRTARVVLPIEAERNGKIILETGGRKLQLTARLFEPEQMEALKTGEEVVVLRMDGRIAEVIRPD